MGKINLIEKVKAILAGVAWRVFLWSSNLTEEEYFKQIYQQEKDINIIRTFYQNCRTK